MVTPVGVRTSGVDEGQGYFEGVDFVNGEEDVMGDGDDGEWDSEEEGEMKRLVWGRARGWVDWAVGWMDFREEGEEEEQEEVDVAQDEGGGEADGRRRRRRTERDRVWIERPADDVGVVGDVPPLQGEGALSDAAWLLSVARKILV